MCLNVPSFIGLVWLSIVNAQFVMCEGEGGYWIGWGAKAFELSQVYPSLPTNPQNLI